ncbi:MAG TPA: zinc finger domain-containing protein [Thermotogota bacterium]|nr:zinc finger domain-containing protein [Thermotogota bacterium]HRW92766.1 zinc finger domain-containing protein [Thermotogota bacterium]
MIEIPESLVIAQQVQRTLGGKRIAGVIAGHSPHKNAWFAGDPGNYPGLLSGKQISGAKGLGSMVEIHAQSTILLVGDGINLRYHPQGERIPNRHQLLVTFEDGDSLSATVQMYGGVWCFAKGTFENPYYLTATQSPSPLLEEFSHTFFQEKIQDPAAQKLSLKGFLATGQRIPGLGNGVLQDILFQARLHPRRKVSSLSPEETNRLFSSLKNTLEQMVQMGGRDTEKDLFGKPGGYPTKMSKKTVGTPCPECGETIVKESYMGGSVYFCPSCQKR